MITHSCSYSAKILSFLSQDMSKFGFSALSAKFSSENPTWLSESQFFRSKKTLKIVNKKKNKLNF